MSNGRGDNEWIIWLIYFGMIVVAIILTLIAGVLFYAGLAGIIIGIIMAIYGKTQEDEDLIVRGLILAIVGFFCALLGNWMYKELIKMGVVSFVNNSLGAHI